MQNNDNNNEREQIEESAVTSELESVDLSKANASEKESENQFETNENATQIKPAKRSLRAIAATAVVGLVGIGVIASSGLINLTMDGEINEISYIDNKLVYDIDVKDVNKDNSIYFEIYENDKSITKYKVIEKEHYEGNKTGEISLDDLNLENRNIESPISFIVRLKGDTGLIDRTYDSWILEINSVESYFKDVKLLCDCKNSGNLLIDLDFKDDLGIFSDFKATLVDSQGTKRDLVFTDNLHETQKIFVLDMAGGEATFTLTYKQNGIIKERIDKVNI